MIYKKEEGPSLEDQIRRVCIFVIVCSLSLAALGYAFAPQSGSNAYAGGESQQDRRSEQITSVLMKVMTALAEDQILQRVEDIPRHKEFKAEHSHHGEAPDQVHLLQQVASARGVTSICQVGLNAGHSAMLLLSAAPEGTMYVFDQFLLPYSEKVAGVLGRVFSNRFHYVQGNPTDTLPWFQKRGEVVCDLSSVDNSKATALTDLVNAIKVTKVGGILMANEFDSEEYEKAWADLIEQGYIKNSECQEDKDAERKWCFALVAKQSGDLDSKILKARAGSFRFDVSMQY